MNMFSAHKRAASFTSAKNSVPTACFVLGRLMVVVIFFYVQATKNYLAQNDSAVNKIKYAIFLWNVWLLLVRERERDREKQFCMTKNGHSEEF